MDSGKTSSPDSGTVELLWFSTFKSPEASIGGTGAGARRLLEAGMSGGRLVRT